MARLTLQGDRRRAAIVFIGFMGAGKSTALAAARDAGFETLASDELLERELGMPIAEFFAKRGEDEFRAREAELVAGALERADGGAIALGGGSVLSQRVRDALSRHLAVWLQVPIREAWRRVQGSGRPLARELSAFEELYAEREPIYESLADAIVPNRARVFPAKSLAAIAGLRELPEGTRMLWAVSDSGSYPIYVGPGLLESQYWPLAGRRFCLTDKTVGRLYASSIEPLAGQVAVEPGESAKTLAEVERVVRELARLGMTRSDHLVALGGGVVGDLGGFCAHTYQRGVALVSVPTSLLAQVDAAYGGKTGVDLPEAKNYVGAYHQPAAVLADLATLGSLPQEELAAGWVEVIKTALLAGGQLWEQVRATASPVPEGLGEIVLRCARTKVEIVSADERDSGARAVLNLGHTVGHAIEAASGYRRYRHGEAVGLGLLAALRLSEADGLRVEVSEILERIGLPLRLDPGVEVASILEALDRDKKRAEDGVGFVLLERPGEPRHGQRVDRDRVREAVTELQRT